MVDRTNAMPIHIDIPIRSISLEEFRNLDYQVMNHAFASQNAIGSLADERVYQVDFASRLLAAGFQVDREVQVILSHKTFKSRSTWIMLSIDKQSTNGRLLDRSPTRTKVSF
jgi:hypothetical protein